MNEHPVMSNRSGAAPSPAEELESQRLHALASQLRCLVCQNQTIADSTAGLAMDLRSTIREQIHAGKSDREIKQYMEERYGEFILYDPPFSAANAMLWTVPFLLVLIGGWLAVRLLRRQEPAGIAAMPDAQRLQALEERYRRSSKPDPQA